MSVLLIVIARVPSPALVLCVLLGRESDGKGGVVAGEIFQERE